jgi:hypothetical protein
MNDWLIFFIGLIIGYTIKWSLTIVKQNARRKSKSKRSPNERKE